MPTIVVRQTTAIQAEGRLFDEVPIETWKDWMTFHFISSYAQFLPRAFDEANFDFYSRTLRGVSSSSATAGSAASACSTARSARRSARSTSAATSRTSSRRQMTELIANLRGALRRAAAAPIAWMDEATRTRGARQARRLRSADRQSGPLHRLFARSGSIRDDLLGNVIRAAEFQWNLQLSRLPNPVDRSLWAMTPQTINAYYSPLTNQITFPAAILQPPFFNPTADPAVNYGAIGAMIGHEIGHGFDDQGRRFDAQGRLRDWWTPQSAERFTERDHAARRAVQRL